jgi:hypothetical protein
MAQRTVPEWAKKRSNGLDLKAGLKHGFRSGLEEENSEIIKANGHAVRFEPFKIPYVIPQSLHTYTLDFLLDNWIIVETKGIFDAQDRNKHLLLKAQHPELDIRFVFSRSKAPIGPGAKSTMADWCNKFGFKFADKRIPAAWFKESGPERDPREVIKELKADGRRASR